MTLCVTYRGAPSRDWTLPVQLRERLLDSAGSLDEKRCAPSRLVLLFGRAVLGTSGELWALWIPLRGIPATSFTTCTHDVCA